MNTYRDKILKEFKIDWQRRSSWLCYKVWVLSKTQDLTTAEERERTKVVPYALQYDVLCTAPKVCLAMSQSRGTSVIQEWITGQRSRLSLVTSGLMNFLDYGGGKRVRRKGLRQCKLWHKSGLFSVVNRIRIVEQLFGIAPSSAW